MEGSQPRYAWLLAAVVGGLVTIALVVRAGAETWLIVDDGPNAADAWDDIQLLQADIVRGQFLRDLSWVWGMMALALIGVWLMSLVAVRSRLAFAALAVFGLSAASWFVAGSAAIVVANWLPVALAVFAIAALIGSRVKGRPGGPAPHSIQPVSPH